MKIAIACFVGLLSSVGVSAEPVLEGRVRLASGEAAVGAHVLVFDLADLSRYVRATTDESGQFVLALGALGQRPGLPEGFGLGQNYPNPFNPGTVIPYELAAASYVRLEVFNLLGQRVAMLVDGEMGVGSYTAQWDARDASGQGVAAGVYVYRLTAGGGVATRRMVLVDGSGSERLSPRGVTGGGVGVRPAVSAGTAGYGLTVSGQGMATYVDADFRVGAGPVEVVVAAAEAARGKAAAGGILGDVNNDGTVDISDALLVTLYSSDSSTAMPNNGDISLGDVNGDGAVDAMDAYLITLYSIDPGNATLPAGIGQPVTVTAVPDMVVDTLTLLPAAIAADTPVRVQVRVANEGSGRASQALVVLRVNGQVVDSIALDFDAGSETGIEFDSQVLGAGSHLIEVVVDPDGALTTEVVRDNNQVEQTVTVTASGSAVRSVVFILDLSGSMDDAAEDGGTRLDAAKAALAEVLAQAPRDGSQEYALTTFSGCGGVEVPIGFTGDPQTVVSYSSGLVADGGTPLAAALRQGQHLGLDEASSENILLVLLSDGEETCDGDPVAVARSIGQGVRAKANAVTKTLAKVISVNAIGFGVEPGSAADQQIQAIAKEAGGNYFRASETADLAVALGQASGLVQTRVPTLSGQVTDADGNPIQGALVQLRNMQENTDANGRYLFPNDAGVQGVDSLIVMAVGYARYAAEVYLFEADKEYDVALGFDAAAYPVAEASADQLSVTSGGQVTLRGDESSDPAGGKLTYHWSQLPSNPFPVSFSHNDSEDAFAVRVTLTDVGTYQFVLEVENEVGLWSVADTVEVAALRAIEERVFSLPGGGEMAFVWIDPGVFQMGSPSTELGCREHGGAGWWDWRDVHCSNEGPVHEVELSRGFWLSKYEVTVGQFRRFVEATGYNTEDRCAIYKDKSWGYHSGHSWRNPGYAQSEDHPVVCVSWEDVQAYAAWLSGETGVLYRLPSEAEWEYACRAGTQTRWSLGHEDGNDNSLLEKYAWYGHSLEYGGHTKAVGGKLPNSWGLHDMHGNVREWVQDWYGESYYNSSPRVDPLGSPSGSGRVMRGGDFNGGARIVRSAHRNNNSPGHRDNRIGVRLLRIR